MFAHRLVSLFLAPFPFLALLVAPCRPRLVIVSVFSPVAVVASGWKPYRKHAPANAYQKEVVKEVATQLHDWNCENTACRFANRRGNPVRAGRSFGRDRCFEKGSLNINMEHNVHICELDAQETKLPDKYI